MNCQYCNKEIFDISFKCMHCGTLLNPSYYISNTENKVLMAKARESLRGYWGMAAVAYLVVVVIQTIPQMVPVIGTLITLLISGSMTTGICIFFLSISRKQITNFNQIFEGFNIFFKALGVYFLVCLFTLLWALLFIIPGIIALLSYSMVFYILADNKNIGIMETLKTSKEIMNGNKWKLFCLYLRFFGWFLLGVLTCGIAFFWIFPYMLISVAKFYDDATKKYPV